MRMHQETLQSKVVKVMQLRTSSFLLTVMLVSRAVEVQ